MPFMAFLELKLNLMLLVDVQKILGFNQVCGRFLRSIPMKEKIIYLVYHEHMANKDREQMQPK